MTTFETFAAYDQLLPAIYFSAIQGGTELPVHTETVPRSLYRNTDLGKAMAKIIGLGRLWSPMVEFLGEPGSCNGGDDGLGRLAAVPGNAQQTATHTCGCRRANSRDQHER